MTDIIDRGCEREALDRDIAIRLKKPRGPIPTGFCATCRREVREGAQFCDAECREDWEREQRRMRNVILD